MVALLSAGGCVERTLTIQSNPPGALVYLNGQEVGRTPMTRNFRWYGKYDLEMRRPGYETLKTAMPVNAPIWQWVPIDLLAEIFPLPLKDHQHFSYKMTPAATQPADPAELMKRAGDLKQKM